MVKRVSSPGDDVRGQRAAESRDARNVHLVDLELVDGSPGAAGDEVGHRHLVGGEVPTDDDSL